jgi:thiol-disulfide isomerase/thioredoxin
MRNSTLFAACLVAALIALAAGVYIGTETRTTHPSEPSIPAEAIARLLATRLNDASGQPQALAQWQGKTLVINFWATWCPPCREEMPSFSQLQSKHASNSVQFVGIALDTADNVRSFSKQHPVSYPLLVADTEGSELTRQLGNSTLALPYTVVLGNNGTVQLVRLGRVTEKELDTLLQKIASTNQ